MLTDIYDEYVDDATKLILKAYLKEGQVPRLILGINKSLLLLILYIFISILYLPSGSTLALDPPSLSRLLPADLAMRVSCGFSLDAYSSLPLSSDC